jgi:hypothetical protein
MCKISKLGPEARITAVSTSSGIIENFFTIPERFGVYLRIYDTSDCPCLLKKTWIYIPITNRANFSWHEIGVVLSESFGKGFFDCPS